MPAKRLRQALVLAVLAAAPRVLAADGATYVVAGELVRISLPRSSVTVKLVGPPPREMELRVDAATVISSRGRPLRLPDLRPGERISAVVADEAGGARRAQRIKLGGTRTR